MCSCARDVGSCAHEHIVLLLLHVKGYLVPKIGKVVSYISFLVRDPGFILYCVSLRIWRRLYTVTLSHRIAPEIRTKTHKI